MNLFERVVHFVKSVGHRVESEEHALLNDFVTFLSTESSVIENFLQSKGLDKNGKEKQIVAKFISEIAPVAVSPTPAPAPVATPAPVAATAPAPTPVTATAPTPTPVVAPAAPESTTPSVAPAQGQ